MCCEKKPVRVVRLVQVVLNGIYHYMGPISLCILDNPQLFMALCD